MRNDKEKTSTTPKVRSFTIQPKYRFNKYSRKIVPEITLCGAWLAEAGFQEGDRISVVSENNELIIRKMAE